MSTSRILIAGDESEIKDLIAEELADRGLSVIRAANGTQAIKMLREAEHISLLISDIRMPDMDGYVLVREAVALHPNLKILLMTKHSVNFATPADLQMHHVRILHNPSNVFRLADEAVEMVAQT